MSTYLIVDSDSGRIFDVQTALTSSLALKKFYTDVGPPIVESLEAIEVEAVIGRTLSKED